MPNRSDKIRLEPLIKKKKRSGTPSMPTSLGGKIGIWRMIRGSRMFFELSGSAFEGVDPEELKSMKPAERRELFSQFFDEKGILLPNQDQIEQGAILEGPADLIGMEIDEVPAEVWTRLTPIQTKKEFSKIKEASDGVKALRASIIDAIGDSSDTRVKRVKEAKKSEELVPIARVSGFTTDEIKKILSSGEKSNNTVGVEQEERKNGEKPEIPLEKMVIRSSRRLGPTRLKTNAGLTKDRDLIQGAIHDIRAGEELSKSLSALEDKVTLEQVRSEVTKIRKSLEEGTASSADLPLLGLLRLLISPSLI